jgi:TatD DNase family protein
MLGLHPTDLPENPKPLLDRMEQALENPEHPYVAIGEVGIDLYWDDTRASEQVVALQRQAEWAIRFNLPLIIHSRAAHRLLVDTLLPFADKLPGGIFHCFGGTAEEAEELLTAFPRFVLGIGGVVTFKKSTLPEVLKTTVPLERIVLETDAPYLAPTPHRGKRNEPAYLTLVVQKLAEIYDVSPAEVERVTTETALRIFPKLANSIKR